MNFQNVPMSHQGVTSIEQSFKLCMGQSVMVTLKQDD